MMGDDDSAFEEMVEFGEQREMLGRFLPTRNYFLDWLTDIINELQGNVSPFGYAARVCTAQKMVEHINLEHATASQKTLLRVIRNLFPYDRVRSASMNSTLSRCLGLSREIKSRPYRTLNDQVVKAPELVELRYGVLVKAIIGYAISLTKVLYDTLQEEAIPDYRHFPEETVKECQADMEELKTYRNYLYFDFPEKEVYAVSTYAESLQEKLKKRKEMPREMDAGRIYQHIVQLQQLLRGQLQAVVIRGKDIRDIILNQRASYLNQTGELTMMISVLQTFMSGDADWHAIEEEIANFHKALDDKFRLDQYLPADVLKDIDEGHTLYREGYIPRLAAAEEEKK